MGKVTDDETVYVDIRYQSLKQHFEAEYVSVESVRPVFEGVPQIGTDRIFEQGDTIYITIAVKAPLVTTGEQIATNGRAGE